VLGGIAEHTADVISLCESCRYVNHNSSVNSTRCRVELKYQIIYI
jgi:hypothetical protein